MNQLHFIQLKCNPINFDVSYKHFKDFKLKITNSWILDEHKSIYI